MKNYSCSCKTLTRVYSNWIIKADNKVNARKLFIDTINGSNKKIMRLKINEQ